MAGHLADRLAAAVRERGTAVCIGLDPAIDRIAAALGLSAGALADPRAACAAIWEFNQRILESAAPYAAAVKPQSAFYERWGADGVEVLARTAQRCREMGLVCILDVKRNDIASTAAAYAQAYLGDGPLGVDAITVNPYLGEDGIAPFLGQGRLAGRGIFVLVKTSNPSSVQVQDLPLEGGKRLYQHIADLVEGWGRDHLGSCGYSDVGAVVGATFPEQLAELRTRMPHTWLLIPGYGSQGGTADDVAPAFDGEGLGAIVNSSRGIIYAGESAAPGTDYAQAAAAAARETRDAVAAVWEARQ